MRRFILGFLAAVAIVPTIAWGLTQSSIPPKFGLAWGQNAGAAYIRSIPQSSQIGIQNCAASLNDGFPPLTFTPSTAGGCPPFGQDFNGILKQLSQWSQWQSAGGPVFYDSGFSSTVNGYPKGSIVQSSVLPGRLWFNQVDNNTTNPDDQTGVAANWIPLPGTTAAGTPTASFTTTPLPNSVISNGLTVGNGSSNATNRANSDTYWLFSFLWTNCSGCQLFNSSGGSISRGANAHADFSANNAIATINMNGSAPIGADSQGSTTSSLLASAPVISGSRTIPGSFIGENTHSLTAAENGPHTHGNTLTDPGHTHGVTLNGPNFVGNASGGSAGGGNDTVQQHLGLNITINAAVTGITINNASSGSGTGHNIVERSAVVYWNVAL